MWGRGAAALIAFAVLGSQPAMAGVRVDSEVSGALTVTWHGDPARGCADAGVCDVTGSVTVRANEGSGSGSSDSSHVLGFLHVQTEGGIVRVTRGAAGAAQGRCLDATGEVRFTPRVVRRAGTRVVLALGNNLFPFGAGLGAGRCAGPVASDLAAAMPQGTMPARVLDHGGAVRLRFGGRRAFAAGPFTGTVTSTLALRGRVTLTRGRIGPAVPTLAPRPGHRRRIRVAEVELAYRVASADGALTTSFQGGPSPDCDALDACGLSGTHELRLAPGGTLTFSASDPLGRRRAPTLDEELAQVRRGALDLSALPLTAWHGQAAVSVTRPDGSACRDGRPVTLTGVSARLRGSDYALELGGPSPGGVDDPLAMRCPGPRGTGLSPAPLATGTLPAGQAGAPELTVHLMAGGGELGAMPLSRGGELNLDLVRTRAVVRTHTVLG